jgi:hypothetical protein
MCGHGRHREEIAMSESSSRLPLRPSLEQLRKQAKDLLKALRAGDSAATQRVGARLPNLTSAAVAGLADVQFVLAREYGFANWSDLVRHVEATRQPGLRRFETLAQAVADAYTSASYEAIRQINWTYGTSFVSYREPDKMHRRLSSWFASASRTPDLALADARHLVARMSGFDDWEHFLLSMSASTGSASVKTAAVSGATFYRLNEEESSIQVRGVLTEPHWDVVLDVIQERRLTGLAASGITDGVLNRISRLTQLERLHIGNSGQLTDERIAAPVSTAAVA